MAYKCDKQTLIEVLKIRPAYYTDKRENKSLMVWTERIVELMQKTEENEETTK